MKVSAAAENAASHRCQPLGQRYFGKACAVHKGAASDLCYRIGKGDRANISLFKCAFAYLRYGLAVDLGGNGEFRRRLSVLCDRYLVAVDFIFKIAVNEYIAVAAYSCNNCSRICGCCRCACIKRRAHRSSQHSCRDQKGERFLCFHFHISSKNLLRFFASKSNYIQDVCGCQAL